MQQANQTVSGGGGGGGGEERAPVNGGRFDFDDGGTFCGGWEDGKAHGHGVCTGPKGQGAYSGSWHYGFEVSGVYTWPSGSSFEGQWQNGKRHGLGVEARGRWLYRGEWTQGFKGRYGVRQSSTSNAKYEGTWANGLQDGYGSETYADGGTYQGQWLRGMRHGYGVRASAPFGLASHYRPNSKALRASLTSLRSAGDPAGGGAGGREAPTPDPAEKRNHRMDDARGGFVLKARSDEPPARRNSLVEKTKKGLLSGLKIRKQRSTGDLEKRGTGSGSIRSNGSTASWVSTESSHSAVTSASMHTDSNASFVVEDEHLDSGVTETYMGEWKNDKRTGFGISERSDGLRYEGEWFANKKYGYGVTTFRDGTKEEGKYKNNVLITSQKKKHLFLIRSAKFRERIDAAVNAAQRASKIALQKADIAISRTATARGKAEQADQAADHAKEDSDLAQVTARQFAPDFKQPGMDRLRIREKFKPPPEDAVPAKSILHPPTKNFDQPVAPAPVPASSQPKTTFASRRPSEAYSQTIKPNDPAYPAPASAYAMQNLSQTQSNPVSSNNNYSQMQQNNANQQSYQKQPAYQQQQTSSYQPQVSNFQQPNSYGQQPQPNYQPTQAQAQSSNYQQNNSYQQQQSSYNNNVQQNNNYNQFPPTQSYNQNSYNQQAYPNNMSNQTQYAGYNQSSLSQDNAYNNMNTLEQNRVPNLPNSIPPGATPMMNDTSSLHQQPMMNSVPYGQPVRRNSRQVGGERPSLSSQASIDHFDHYKRPPSRDSSVDRYARATGRMSRQPSVDKTGAEPAPLDRSVRGASQMRAGTPLAGAANGSVMTGQGSRAATPSLSNQAQMGQIPPFEDVLLRQRNLGQDIIPSLAQPKRTESLYIGSKAVPPPVASGGGGGGGGGGARGGGMKRSVPVSQPLQRKKSLPDVQALPRASDAMSREEVSVLGSARREEVRRMADESERLRANPLLYLVSPQVKDWFSRQQLVMLVLFINISLAIMFFKLLT